MKLYFSTCTNIIYINDDTINPTQLHICLLNFPLCFLGVKGRGCDSQLLSRNSLVAYSIPEARATTDETRHEGVGERGANSLAVNAAGAFQPTPRRRHGVAPITSLIQHNSAFVRGKASYFLQKFPPSSLKLKLHHD